MRSGRSCYGSATKAASATSERRIERDLDLKEERLQI